MPSSNVTRLANATSKSLVRENSTPGSRQTSGPTIWNASPLRSQGRKSIQDLHKSDSDDFQSEPPISGNVACRGRGAVRRSLGHEEATPPSITTSPPPLQSRFERRVTRGQRDIAAGKDKSPSAEGKLPEKGGAKTKLGTRGPAPSKASAKRHKQG